MNPKFIDVDFREYPEFGTGDLGAPLFADTGPAYEDVYSVMSDAEIMEAVKAQQAAGGGNRLLVTRIFDQKQEGSCVANAYAQANQIVQARQFGRDKVIQLAAISLYKRIGRSASSGANVGDGWEEMLERGILPLDTPENRARFKHCMQNTGFSTPFPKGWEETAALFKGDEHLSIKTLPGLKTALCNQHPVVVGRDGHSICYDELIEDDGDLFADYPNSWGLKWGDKGHGRDSEAKMKKSATYAYAVISVVRPT